MTCTDIPRLPEHLPTEGLQEGLQDGRAGQRTAGLLPSCCSSQTDRGSASENVWTAIRTALPLLPIAAESRSWLGQCNMHVIPAPDPWRGGLAARVWGVPRALQAAAGALVLAVLSSALIGKTNRT